MGYYVRAESKVKIYLEDINPGGGKTILFLHGWPLNHKAYEYQFDQLPKMGYRCIGMDTRGFGIHDKICLFPLAKVLEESIKNSKLIPFKNSGHGLFWEQRDKFNKELMQFIEQ